jgi:hypothetical protein
VLETAREGSGPTTISAPNSLPQPADVRHAGLNRFCDWFALGRASYMAAVKAETGQHELV